MGKKDLPASFIFLLTFPSDPSGRFRGLPEPDFLVEAAVEVVASPPSCWWPFVVVTTLTFEVVGGEERTPKRKSRTSSMMHLNNIKSRFRQQKWRLTGKKSTSQFDDSKILLTGKFFFCGRLMLVRKTRRRFNKTFWDIFASVLRLKVGIC